jgi:hypothetical protein
MLACACAATVTLLASGCGGGARQDHSEPKGTFTMRVVRARFPAVQPIARETQFELWVRNTSASTVPTVAVTIDSFSYTATTPGLASNKRPIWVIERGPGAVPKLPVETAAISPPGGGQTAYVNTWALGPLAPGRTRRFLWRVVPVKPGVHSVTYSVAAGLSGRALARTSAGGLVRGRLTALVTAAPPPTHVNPTTGQVEPGRFPLQP